MTDEASSFDWSYENKETCLLLEYKVTVRTEGGKQVKFGAADLVFFQEGMDCGWDVHKSVHQHFQFGDKTNYLIKN